ncbi:MAG TPA: GNAT family N-acetyltransferase [Chitinophagaceae bacterium]|nr:GNAT family N-acetyltransferase [Chitinophagaceae bacterium]
MPIVTATEQDIPQLVSLLNSAYRGDASKKGWTTEADLIAGQLRTDEPTLNELLHSPGAVFLKSVDDEGRMEGCVFLQKKIDKLYLGMLSVSPLLQAKGTGKRLMTAAETYARENGCSAIFMRVVSLRPELIAWYERQGYRDTGVTEPFPEDGKFGVPVREFVFLIMEKAVLVE